MEVGWWGSDHTFAAVTAAILLRRAQKKAEREAMLRNQFEEKRAERVQKYQVGVGGEGPSL